MVARLPQCKLDDAFFPPVIGGHRGKIQAHGVSRHVVAEQRIHLTGCRFGGAWRHTDEQVVGKAEALHRISVRKILERRRQHGHRLGAEAAGTEPGLE